MNKIFISNSRDTSFGIGSRLFCLLFLYYASRGEDLIFFIIMAAFFFLLVGLVIKRFKIVYSLSSIILVFTLTINLLLSLLAPDATRAYISTQCFWLIIAVIGITLEKYFFNKKSEIAKMIVWVTGLLLLTVYIAAIFNPQLYWIFESFFLTEDGAVSKYSNGAVRFYTIAAVCFLIIPVHGYSKLPSFLINALPLSPVNILAWFAVNVKVIHIAISLFLLGIFLFFNSEYTSNLIIQFFSLVDDKFLSLISRSDKISVIHVIGSSSTFDDNFSETFWIALAQSNGILPAFILFLLFFYKIFMLSKNMYFIFASVILSCVNPFPLALIYLLADSWNTKVIKNE